MAESWMESLERVALPTGGRGQKAAELGSILKLTKLISLMRVS